MWQLVNSLSKNLGTRLIFFLITDLQQAWLNLILCSHFCRIWACFNRVSGTAHRWLASFMYCHLFSANQTGSSFDFFLFYCVSV